jgi:glucosamine kinase
MFPRAMSILENFVCGRTALMPFFLGIDGGGSKTSCLAGDEISVLGSGTAGPSNMVRVGEVLARESLTAAIRQSCRVAGVDPAQLERTYVGIAGAAQREISEAVRRMVSEIVSGEVKVVGDMEIALAAAFGPGPGIIVIAGTGSIAYGRNAQGTSTRAGGWGYAVSDEGSGYWIGWRAVASALRAYDGSQQGEPPLLRKILQAWRLENLEQLVRKANATPAPDFAALFPHLVAAADSGEPLARNVLGQAGAELAALGKLVIGQLFPQGGRVPVAMSGGVFRHSALVRQIFYNNLRCEYPDSALNPTVIEPVRGALELARKGARP